VKRYQIKHQNDLIAKDAIIADTFLSRAKGLLGLTKIEGFDALIIEPCNSIHTFFMKFSIDVIFVNKENTIVKVFENLKPWRITRTYFTARKVIELEAGTLKGRLHVGDQLEIGHV